MSGVSCRHATRLWGDHHERHAHLLADVLADVMLCERCDDRDKMLWLVWLRDESARMLDRLLSPGRPAERRHGVALGRHTAPTELVCVN